VARCSRCALCDLKTLISLQFLKYLTSIRKLPRYVLFSSTRETFAHLVEEIRQLGLEPHPLIPTKGTSERTTSLFFDGDNEAEGEDEDEEEALDVKKMRPYCINVVEHDHLRLCKSQIVELGSEVLFILDESDKCMNDSLRTSAAIDIAKNAAGALLMTGTVLVDANLVKLTQWLSLCVNCEVTPRNAFAIANSMVSNEAEIKVRVERPDPVADETTDGDLDRDDVVFGAVPGAREKHRSLAPVRFGGTNREPSEKTFRQLLDLAWDACDVWNVEHMRQHQPERPSVFLVRSDEHAQRVKQLLLGRISGLVESDVYVLGRDNATFVTSASIRAGGHFPRCFLFSINNCRGFELTAYDRMYSSVYLCNLSTRDQAEGRLVRMSQEHEVVEIHTTHCGILTTVNERQDRARSMAEALADLKTYFAA
jgi:hypothetical protein